jgi:acyl transferase domain-containing protein
MTENLFNYLIENPVNPVNPLNPVLPDVAYTLQVGRKAFKHRAMLVASSVKEAAEILNSPDRMQFHVLKEERQNVVFMFPGQGSQYVGMGLNLYEREPVFREEMDRCFEILTPIMGYDIKEILYPANRSNRSYRSNINHTEITQPVIFAIEYALAKLLMTWGIKPRAMIGHSIGEYVAACLSGVFSLADALEIVSLRGKLMQEMPGGAMLGVSLAEKELKPLLADIDHISLAAVNSSSLCVVSGTYEAVEVFEKQLEQKGYKNRRVHTSHAFHSPMMDPVVETFVKEVERVTPAKPKIRCRRPTVLGPAPAPDRTVPGWGNRIVK